MRPSPFLAVILGLLWSCGPLYADGERHANLANNPFSRPEVLKPKPPPPPAPVVKPKLPPEQIELDLTATMVSQTSPMVVVDGELLGLGDRIEGFRLIAVMEGKAVFLRNGRKYSFDINAGRPK